MSLAVDQLMNWSRKYEHRPHANARNSDAHCACTAGEDRGCLDLVCECSCYCTYCSGVRERKAKFGTLSFVTTRGLIWSKCSIM